MTTASDPRRRCFRPELGPDRVELVQGCLHGIPNRVDAFEPEAGRDEIRLDAEPFQRIRLRPVEPSHQRSGICIERRGLSRFSRRTLGQEPNDAVPERLVFVEQELDRALADPGVLVEGVERDTRDSLGFWNRIVANSRPTAALNLQPYQWRQ